MAKIIEIHAVFNGEAKIDTYDFRGEGAGSQAVFMAMRLNVLNTEGYVRTFAHTTGDVHIIEYTLYDIYSARNILVSAYIDRFGMTYPQARRAAMRSDGMTLDQIAKAEGVGLSTIQDSIDQANQKIKENCD